LFRDFYLYPEAGVNLPHRKLASIYKLLMIQLGYKKLKKWPGDCYVYLKFEQGYGMINREQDIERISEEIHRYLTKHPNAADTLEGITRWWLTRQRYEESKKNVQKALYLLVNRKLVAQIDNLDGKCTYKSI